MSVIISSSDVVDERGGNSSSRSEVKFPNQDQKVDTTEIKELTPDHAYDVGENTLETLPGTITPPVPIYSPKEKLTESCISVASTPTNLDCKMRNDDGAMVELGHYLLKGVNSFRKKRQRVCFITSDGENVDGKGNPIRKILTETELIRRRKKHQKILKRRKRMWHNYQKAKLQTCTNKVEIRIKGIHVNVKRNEGDLL